MVMPPNTPMRAGRWGRRQWGHVALSVVGLALLVCSTWFVLHDQFGDWYFRHGVGGWICDKLRPIHAFYDSDRSPNDRSRETIILERAGVFSDPGWVTTRDLIDGLPASLARGERAWLVRLSQWHRDSGLWARTRRRMGGRLSDDDSIGPFDGDWGFEPPATQAQAEALRTAGLDALRACNLESARRGRSELIATGEWLGTFPLVSGYFVNTATVVGLGMWAWFTPVVVRNVVRWRRWRRGGCARCGYDVRGLPNGARVCPECGGELKRDHHAGEVSPAPPQG